MARDILRLYLPHLNQELYMDVLENIQILKSKLLEFLFFLFLLIDSLWPKISYSKLFSRRYHG